MFPYNHRSRTLNSYLGVNMNKVTLIACLLLPFFMLSQAIESSRHIEIIDKSLVPERFSSQLLLLDFAKTDAKWESVENHEDKLTIGYGEKLGQRGFFMEGPEVLNKKLKHPDDTAWQLMSTKFTVKGMSSLKGVVDFYTNAAFAVNTMPFRNHYVNSVFWFAADGSSLGRTAFSVKVKQEGRNLVTFRMAVPERAVEAQLAVGADNPNIKKGNVLLITRASVDGMPAKDAGYFTDAEVILPPVRFSPDAPIRNYVSDTPATRWIQVASQCPKGTALLIETAFAADNN